MSAIANNNANLSQYFFKSQESLATVIDNEEEPQSINSPSVECREGEGEQEEGEATPVVTPTKEEAGEIKEEEENTTVKAKD